MESNKKRKAPRATQTRRKANTTAVLGRLKAEVEVNPKWQEHYRALLEMRERLREQKARLVQEAAEAYTGPRRDPADVGTNLYDSDWALGMATSEQEALYEIEEAINRIHTGTYGTCELTGKPIAAERLKAIPWTRFSVEAERELEATGQLKRARLGRLKSMERESQDWVEGGDEGEGKESGGQADPES